MMSYSGLYSCQNIYKPADRCIPFKIDIPQSIYGGPGAPTYVIFLYSSKQEVKIHDVIYDVVLSSATSFKNKQPADRCLHLK